MIYALVLFALIPHANASGFEFHFGSDGRFAPLSDVPPGITLQRAATMTNDRDKNIHYLNIMIDDKGLLAGLYNEADPKNKPGEGDVGGEKVFWLRDIESAEGVVLASGSGRKVLILKGLLDRATQEGRFNLKYLANGLTMRYGSCDFDFKRQPNNGAWYVQNVHTGATVTEIRIETHMLGLKPIKAICK